jgi:flagellar protein FlgJ
MTPADFITTIAPVAQSGFAASGIWPSFVIVQAIFESSWGGSELTQQANNLFGIKADSGWTGATFSMPTGEDVLVDPTNPASGYKKIIVQANWRSYPDWLSSIQDHANFLRTNQRYAAAFQTTNVNDFIQAIAAAGYSTNPNYATMLTDEISARNLTQYDTVTS